MDSDLVTAELADRIANAEARRQGPRGGRRAPAVPCGLWYAHAPHTWTPTCGYHALKRCHGRTE